MITRKGQMSESFRLGALLAIVGGFLDAYSYLARGGVFANAQTGNIVLLGLHAAQGHASTAFSYLPPIFAFAFGVLAAELVKSHCKQQEGLTIHWRQLIVLGELILLGGIAFLPQGGKTDTLANIIISFVCALQVEAFRKVRGSAFATTMCTGNLRSGTELFARWLQLKDPELALKSLRYFAIILFFILGAAFGTYCTHLWGIRSVFVCCGALALAFIMMFVVEERVQEENC